MANALREVSRLRTSLVCRLARRARRLGPVGCRAVRGVMRTAAAPAVNGSCGGEAYGRSCPAGLLCGRRLEGAGRALSRAVSDRLRYAVEMPLADAVLRGVGG